jgi:hypothetical protein
MPTLDEIRSNLAVAAALRVPPLYDESIPPDERVDPAKPERLDAQTRVESYEDHMTKSAIYRGELEENLLTVQASIKDLEDEWSQVEGWQTLVDPKDNTKRAVVEAKRKLAPLLYEGIREGKWLADKLRTQVRRLEQDESTVSRLYSMLTGS